MPRSPRRATKLSQVRRTRVEEAREGLFDAPEGGIDRGISPREMDDLEHVEGFALLAILSHR